jgi:iron complex transport system substrate-binding protein
MANGCERAVEDALERAVDVRLRPERIVSLSPALTDLLEALGAGDRLIAAIPDDPDPEALLALAPDLVLALREEPLLRKRPRARRRSFIEIVAALESRAPVYVAEAVTVEDAVALVGEIGDLVDAEPGRLAELIARVRAGAIAAREMARGSSPVFCPIRRDPWIVVSTETFLHDALVTSGARPLFAGPPERNRRRVTLDEVRAAAPAAILLPASPWPFGEADLAELSAIAPTALVDGRVLTRPGVHTARLDEVARAIAEARDAARTVIHYPK